MTFLMLLLVFLFFITSYLAAIENSTTLRIISVVLLVIAIAVESIIAVAIIFAKMPSYPNLDTLVKGKLDSYFDKINAQHIKKGFYWRAVPHHYWIELRIESEEDNVLDKRRKKIREEKAKEEEKKQAMAKAKKPRMEQEPALVSKLPPAEVENEHKEL